MAPDTDSPRSDSNDLALRWSGRVSLTRRILAVNIFALLLLAGGFFYLDSYRARILDSRTQQAMREARLIAEGLSVAGPDQQEPLIRQLARDTGGRLRIYAADGPLLLDSRALGERNFILRDPDKDGTGQRIARFLDAGIDTVVGAKRPPLYREKADGRTWTDVRIALTGYPSATVWRAPDRTPVITAAARIPGRPAAVMTTVNARDITQTVRVERFRLSVGAPRRLGGVTPKRFRLSGIL